MRAARRGWRGPAQSHQMVRRPGRQGVLQEVGLSLIVFIVFLLFCEVHLDARYIAVVKVPRLADSVRKAQSHLPTCLIFPGCCLILSACEAVDTFRRGIRNLWIFQKFVISRCKQFQYGGTRGNQNNFLTKAMCERTCSSA